MTSTAAVDMANSLNQGFDRFFAFLPNLLGFLVILIVGYFIAKAVKGILTKLLQKAGLDKALHSGQTGQYVEKVSPGASPSRLVGSIGFWTIFLFVLTAAIGALKIPAVTAFMTSVPNYLPKAIVAVLIFVVGGAIAGAVGGLVAKAMGDTPTGKVVGAVAPTLIMGITVFMVLDQLEIAPQIVQITYTALIGGTALALALAFGLGGRDVAGRLLDDAYGKGQDEKDTVKRDMQLAKERGQERAEEARDKAQGGGNGSTGATPSTTTSPQYR